MSLNPPVAYAKRPSQVAGIHLNAQSTTRHMPDKDPVLTSDPEPCDPLTGAYFQSMDRRPLALLFFCGT